MHILPVLVFFVVMKAALLCAFGGPRRFWAFIRDCVTIDEDHWTWTTQDGGWFEDAEIQVIERGELVLKHRHGVVRLTIDALSERSRHLLFRTQKWADYLTELSESGTIVAFAEERAVQVA